MQTRKLVATTLVHGLAALSLSAAVSAGELPKEGTYDYIACGVAIRTSVNFSKTQFAHSTEGWGTIRSNPPGGMFDNNSYRCVGTVATLDGQVTGTTLCEAIDSDGSKRLSVIKNQDGKTTRETIAGTGKYEGIVMSASNLEFFGPFPEIRPGSTQVCSRQTGTYKLK
jgi:hypothetical protein